MRRVGQSCQLNPAGAPQVDVSDAGKESILVPYLHFCLFPENLSPKVVNKQRSANMGPILLVCWADGHFFVYLFHL